MNNILRFPASPMMQQAQQGQAKRFNPMQAVMQQFRRGMNPERILEQMAGPEVQQARKIIFGKSPQQLRGIAYNMAQQSGVRLEDVAAELGLTIPE